MLPVYPSCCVFRQFAESPELLTTLGLLYMRAGQHQKAFEQLGSALAHQNDSAAAILAAGSMMQVSWGGAEG